MRASRGCPAGMPACCIIRRLATRLGKSTLKIGLSLIVGVVAGSAVAEYGWRYYFNTLRDAQQLTFMLSAERQAQSAYFGRSPEIAELELTRLLPILETAPPRAHGDAREQAFRRFVAHARLAKVQQAQGKQPDAQKNFETALSFMRSAFPDSKASSSDDVLLALRTIDNATKRQH
jgi:hypothetical protein